MLLRGLPDIFIWQANIHGFSSSSFLANSDSDSRHLPFSSSSFLANSDSCISAFSSMVSVAFSTPTSSTSVAVL